MQFEESQKALQMQQSSCHQLAATEWHDGRHWMAVRNKTPQNQLTQQQATAIHCAAVGAQWETVPRRRQVQTAKGTACIRQRTCRALLCHVRCRAHVPCRATCCCVPGHAQPSEAAEEVVAAHTTQARPQTLAKNMATMQQHRQHQE
jgi:hypothetical protein